MRHPGYVGLLGVFLGTGLLACGSGQAIIMEPFPAETDGGEDGGNPDSGPDATMCKGSACDAGGVVSDGGCEGGGSCLPPGSVGAGGRCTFSADCNGAYYCGDEGTCVPVGKGGVGATCTTSGSCVKGAVCYRATSGLYGVCSAPDGTTLPAESDGGDGGSVHGASGTSKGIGGACKTLLDCQAGLACDASSQTCEPGVPGAGLPLPWTGVTCTDDTNGSADAGSKPVTAYFELPAADGTPPNDFFRLPFPNDIRRDPTTHRINLTGFPHPGTALLGFDIVERYVEQSEVDLDGFGTNQYVYFRFSGAVQQTSLTVGTGGSVQMYDLTAGAPVDSLGFYAETAGNHYICQNNVKVTTGPMVAGHTYAVTLSTAVHDARNAAILRDAQFASVMGSSAPSGATLTSAYAAFAPLRTFLRTQGINAATILDATVFTTQSATSEVDALRTTVRAEPAPVASGFVKCETGVTSPCDDGLSGAAHTRGCIGPFSSAYDELQGQITVPIMQQGVRPYTTLGQGAIKLDSKGHPIANGTEKVCVSLTVPHGISEPAGGWPVVLYAHGTGGFYRSGILEGLASAVTNVVLGGSKTAAFAFLGYDGVMTGPRQGGAGDQDPDTLFFNFANPVAARDNVLQGAADLFALVRALGTVSLPKLPEAADTTHFDATKVYFLGHSQGSIVGIPAAAYEPGLAGMVFSGAGGDLRESLLTKQNPVDIADLTPYVLEDTQVDVTHPALNMFQAFIERADPVNYGALLLSNLPTGIVARPLVQTYGLGDTYAPLLGLQAIASSIGLQPVAPVPGSMPWPSSTGLALPLSGNFDTSSGMVTAALLEADPKGAYDGHFVLFDDPALQKRVMQFLGTAATGTATVE